MFLFCVGIGHTNLYNCISWGSDIMPYIELFDTASHSCGWRQEWHPVGKTLLQYSSSTLLKKECDKEEVHPYRKTDYKPMIYYKQIWLAQFTYIPEYEVDDKISLFYVLKTLLEVMVTSFSYCILYLHVVSLRHYCPRHLFFCFNPFQDSQLTSPEKLTIT